VHLSLSDSPALKLVHITDLHHRGDQSYLNKILRLVNELKPDLVCLTGDLVDKDRFLPPVLAAVELIDAPVFAVPGNWEHWAGVDFSRVDESCRKTGGALLANSSVAFRDRWRIVGIDNVSTGNAHVERAFADVRDGDQVIFLTHCPLGIELVGERRVTLALAGHSHGGQVRLPIVGALVVPNGVGPYERGYYETRTGPLYVNPGIGTWFVPVRLFCRPEITVIAL